MDLTAFCDALSSSLASQGVHVDESVLTRALSSLPSEAREAALGPALVAALASRGGEGGGDVVDAAGVVDGRDVFDGEEWSRGSAPLTLLRLPRVLLAMSLSYLPFDDLYANVRVVNKDLQTVVSTDARVWQGTTVALDVLVRHVNLVESGLMRMVHGLVLDSAHLFPGNSINNNNNMFGGGYGGFGGQGGRGNINRPSARDLVASAALRQGLGYPSSVDAGERSGPRRSGKRPSKQERARLLLYKLVEAKMTRLKALSTLSVGQTVPGVIDERYEDPLFALMGETLGRVLASPLSGNVPAIELPADVRQVAARLTPQIEVLRGLAVTELLTSRRLQGSENRVRVLDVPLMSLPPVALNTITTQCPSLEELVVRGISSRVLSHLAACGKEQLKSLHKLACHIVHAEEQGLGGGGGGPFGAPAQNGVSEAQAQMLGDAVFQLLDRFLAQLARLSLSCDGIQVRLEDPAGGAHAPGGAPAFGAAFHQRRFSLGIPLRDGSLVHGSRLQELYLRDVLLPPSVCTDELTRCTSLRVFSWVIHSRCLVKPRPTDAGAGAWGGGVGYGAAAERLGAPTELLNALSTLPALNHLVLACVDLMNPNGWSNQRAHLSSAPLDITTWQGPLTHFHVTGFCDPHQAVYTIVRLASQTLRVLELAHEIPSSAGSQVHYGGMMASPLEDTSLCYDLADLPHLHTLIIGDHLLSFSKQQHTDLHARTKSNLGVLVSPNNSSGALRNLRHITVHDEAWATPDTIAQLFDSPLLESIAVLRCAATPSLAALAALCPSNSRLKRLEFLPTASLDRVASVDRLASAPPGTNKRALPLGFTLEGDGVAWLIRTAKRLLRLVAAGTPEDAKFIQSSFTSLMGNAQFITNMLPMLSSVLTNMGELGGDGDSEPPAHIAKQFRLIFGRQQGLFSHTAALAAFLPAVTECIADAGLGTLDLCHSSHLLTPHELQLVSALVDIFSNEDVLHYALEAAFGPEVSWVGSSASDMTLLAMNGMTMSRQFPMAVQLLIHPHTGLRAGSLLPQLVVPPQPQRPNNAFGLGFGPGPGYGHFGGAGFPMPPPPADDGADDGADDDGADDDGADDNPFAASAAAPASASSTRDNPFAS